MDTNGFGLEVYGIIKLTEFETHIQPELDIAQFLLNTLSYLSMSHVHAENEHILKNPTSPKKLKISCPAC